MSTRCRCPSWERHRRSTVVFVCACVRDHHAPLAGPIGGPHGGLICLQAGRPRARICTSPAMRSMTSLRCTPGAPRAFTLKSPRRARFVPLGVCVFVCLVVRRFVCACVRLFEWLCAPEYSVSRQTEEALGAWCVDRFAAKDDLLERTP